MIDRGLRRRDIGKTLSWPEFREFLLHLEPVKSAYMRKRYPDEAPWDVPSRLAAATASAAADTRYLLAVQVFGSSQDVPERFYPVEYGPTESKPIQPQGRPHADVQADADLLRSEMGLVA